MPIPGVPSDPSGLETLQAFSRAFAFNRWQYQKISKYLQGSVLEIGSGIGNISTFLLKNQFSVALSDLRPEYCRLLEEKFNDNKNLVGVYELDLSEDKFDAKHPELLEKFDTVIALNVIEHIRNDVLAIRNASSLLRNNGNLVILVPAGQWLYNRLDQELGHCKRYSKDSLNKLLKTTGLTISHSCYFNAAAIAGWWISGKLFREKKISPGKLNVFNHLIPLFKITDWFVSPFMGLSVISVGTKNLN